MPGFSHTEALLVTIAIVAIALIMLFGPWIGPRGPRA